MPQSAVSSSAGKERAAFLLLVRGHSRTWPPYFDGKPLPRVSSTLMQLPPSSRQPFFDCILPKFAWVDMLQTSAQLALDKVTKAEPAWL